MDSRQDNRDDLLECCSVLKVQLREVQNHENHQKLNFGALRSAKEFEGNDLSDL